VPALSFFISIIVAFLQQKCMRERKGLQWNLDTLHLNMLNTVLIIQKDSVGTLWFTHKN